MIKLVWFRSCMCLASKIPSYLVQHKDQSQVECQLTVTNYSVTSNVCFWRKNMHLEYTRNIRVFEIHHFES